MASVRHYGLFAYFLLNQNAVWKLSNFKNDGSQSLFFLRRMLRISWTEKKSNLEVLRTTADVNEGSLSK